MSKPVIAVVVCTLLALVAGPLVFVPVRWERLDGAPMASWSPDPTKWNWDPDPSESKEPDLPPDPVHRFAWFGARLEFADTMGPGSVTSYDPSASPPFVTTPSPDPVVLVPGSREVIAWNWVMTEEAVALCLVGLMLTFVVRRERRRKAAA